MNFRDELTEKYSKTLAGVEEFLKDNGHTNFDVLFDDTMKGQKQGVKISGWVSKTGNSFDELFELLKTQYKKVQFDKWDGETATFTFKY